MVSFRMAGWIQRTLGLRPRFKRIRRRKIAGLNRGAVAGSVVHLEQRVLLAGTPTQITDANSNTQFQNASSNPTEFTEVGSLTFFTYNTTVTNKPVLGFTNGTTGGTSFVDFRFSPGTKLTNLTEFNGSLYFFATGVETIGGQLQTRGQELWKYDPGTGVTSMVFDIVGDKPNPNTTSGVKQNEGSAGAELIEVAGKLYFTASDDITGNGGNRELWVTDAVGNTSKVSEIFAGTESSNPTQLTDVNGVLFFVATSGPGTGRELWKFNPASDAVPVLVKDIRPGIADSGIENLTAVGDVVYFSANDGVNGNELWISDGTGPGTVMAEDIWVGAQSSNPQSFVNHNGTLFFSAEDGVDGRELWKSNHLASPDTEKVRNIARRGPNNTVDEKQNSNPRNLTVFNGKVYFTANDGYTGEELWVTDGTFAGTHAVADINVELTSSADSTKSAFPGSLTVMNGALYFIATNTFSEYGETDFELYRMTTSETVSLVREINTLPSFWANTAGQQFFKSNDDSFLATSPTYSPIGLRTNFSTNQLFVSNGRLYFAADNGINGATGLRGSSFNTFGEYTPNFELWSSDGSSAGTIQLADLTVPVNLSSSPTKLTTVPDPTDADRARVYFTYLDPNTGRYNLAYTQTSISEPNFTPEAGRPGTTYDVGVSFDSDIANPVAMGGKLYFFASDNNNVNGRELWMSDGTVSGTVMVADVRAGANGSSGSQLVATANRLFWVAESGASNLELWTSDGTVGNATALTSIAGTPNIQGLTVVGTRVYFAATDPTPATSTLPAIQRRLWFSDGTVANTRIVVSTAAAAVPANPTGPFGPLNPENLVALNGQLFFSAGGMIYRTNGTDAGTIPLPNVPGGLTGIANLTAVEDVDRLYFTADDGVNGNELWTSNFDGTTVQLASNIAPGAASSNPQNLTAVGSALYFSADGGGVGRELYRASGASSTLVLDINPGAASSNPSNLLAGGTSGNLFFSATNVANGTELWRASGGSATLQGDINPGAANSSPGSFAYASNQVYFAANDGVNGRELWRNGGHFGGLNGVIMVRDLGLLTTGNANVRDFAVIGERVYYIATTGPNVSTVFRSLGAGLFETTDIETFSDGRLLTDQNIINSLQNRYTSDGQYLATDLVAMGGNLYLAAATGASDANGLYGAELYRINSPGGNNPVATLLGDIRLASTGTNAVPSFLTVLGSQILFAANDGTNGTELWSSGGGAPTMLLNIDGGAGDSNPRFLQTIGNRVYFTAGPANARTAYVTDGTAAGTIQLSTAIVDERNGDGKIFTQSGNRVFFSANGGNGLELWSTNGTAAGTSQVKDIRPGAAGSDISDMVSVNGILYFGANDGVHGSELWRSDGTSAGTVMVEDIEIGSVGSNPSNFVIANNSTLNNSGAANGTPTVLFAATTALYGRELWQTDGTEAGTIIVKDIAPGVRSSNPTNLTSIDGTIYFAADDGVSGNTLWRSVGVDQLTGNTLTVRVKTDGNLAQGGVLGTDEVAGLRNPGQFTLLTLNSNTFTRLFFSASSDAGRNEAYELDINHTPMALTLVPGQVAENMPVGAVAGTLQTFDPDAGDTFQYAFVTGTGDTDNALFEIVGNSLQAKASLNFELKSSYSVRVRTTDQRGQFLERVLTISVTDVNEKPWGLSVTNPVTSLPELTTTPPVTPQRVPLGVLKADDDALQLTNEYALSNGTEGDASHFEIEKDSFGVWQLYLKAGVELDYEVKNVFKVDISIFDPTLGATAASPDATITFTLNLTDVDESDVGPITDLDATVEIFDETVAPNTPVGITAKAVDPDGSAVVTYSLDVNPDGLFKIDAVTGIVSTALELNRESPNRPTHTITVRATSTDGSFSVRDFVITVNDVNEFPVTPIVDNNPAVDAVDENLPIGTAVGITAFSVDADATTNGITYSLDDSAGGLFAIDSTTGVVTTAAVLDREVAPGGVYSIVVRALSEDGSSETKTFTIAVNDIDEFDVTEIVDNDPAVDGVDENSPVGTTAGITAYSVDADATNNAIVYSLDDSAGGRFQIDPLTGVVTTAALINRENPLLGSYTIIVRATSADTSTDTQTYTIAINDIDEFDATPIVDSNSGPDAVDENSSIGTPVGITAFSADADATTNVITYSLDNSAGGRFAINPVTGVVTTAALIDRESPLLGSYDIVVRAASQDGSWVTRTYTIAINDIDEFDATAIVDSNGAADAVNENSPIGTPVGVRAFSVDADATTSAISYSLDDSAGGRFQIDPLTGVVTTAALINRESPLTGSYNITIRAASEDGSAVTRTFTIVIDDVDEFDATPIVDNNPAAEVINENVPIGTPVGITASSVDADATNSAITYSLDNSAGGLFQINPVTGVVTTAAPINRESPLTPSHSITVRATSQDGSATTRTFTIVINDVDEFDVSPITDNNPATNAVDENAPVGTSVGITAHSTDADATNNAVTYSLDNSAGGLFQIHPTTGVITTAALINREAPLVGSYNIVVRATSQDGSTTTRTYAIAINDVDEFDVGAISDANPAANRVPEHSPVGTPVGITAFAQDLDGTNNGITYSLWNTRAGRFAIDPVTGVVTVANPAILDREAQATWTITVLATSQDGSVSVKEFTIELTDVNEFKVGKVFDLDPAPSTIVENAPYGTPVGITAFAIDLDSANSAVTYSLHNTRAGRFAINPTTGVVYVDNGSLIDREVQGTWTVTVLATSQDGSVSVEVFTINVQDVDEHNVDKVYDLDGAPNFVAENSPNGTTVGVTAFGIDLDATNNVVTYSLIDNAGGRFAIDPVTGVVTVAAGTLLDREAAPSWGIMVRARSQDGSFRDQYIIIDLGDVDDFDIGTVGDANELPNNVPENSPAGTLVGLTAKAVDGDATNNRVTYTLTNNAGGRFVIDPHSGVVKVASGAVLDFETTTSHQITVKATSTDGSESTRSFTINVTNVADTPRMTLSNNTVAENLASGAVVGTLGMAEVSVTSPVYTFVTGTGSSDNAKFSISGRELRTRESFNFEAKSSYSIRVQMRDASGLTVTEVFTILVRNVNEGPTGLTLSSSSIAENNSIGAVVGMLLGVDPDGGDTLNYTLVAGSGSTDNARFTIVGNELRAAEVFQYKRNRSYSIRVRVTDGAGLSYEKSLTIKITR